jgi:8-amino-7-oxononanoate synthase
VHPGKKQARLLFLRALCLALPYKHAHMSEPEPLQQVERTYVRFRRRKLSYFAGCDYFRLASHPRVIAALKTAVDRYGLNVAASRLTSGNHHLYGELELELTKFFEAQTATLVNTGSSSNTVAAQALAGNFSHALVDELAHPSLVDCTRFLDCPVIRFKHRDPEDAKRAVQRCGPGASLILLTDGMFAREGTAAPLKEYLEVLPKDALMMIDDAHGAGVLGKSGKGTPEHAGVGRSRIIQNITLSKAFGIYGGAILGSKTVRRKIFERSRLFIGSTPLPLPLANAALQSIRLLKADKRFRMRLNSNAAYVKSALQKAGLMFLDKPGPIITLTALPAPEFPPLKRALLAAGIYPSFIRYPGGPATGYFRFVISSEHSRTQLDRLINALLAHFDRGR